MEGGEGAIAKQLNSVFIIWVLVKCQSLCKWSLHAVCWSLIFMHDPWVGGQEYECRIELLCISQSQYIIWKQQQQQNNLFHNTCLSCRQTDSKVWGLFFPHQSDQETDNFLLTEWLCTNYIQINRKNYYIWIVTENWCTHCFICLQIYILNTNTVIAILVAGLGH